MALPASALKASISVDRAKAPTTGAVGDRKAEKRWRDPVLDTLRASQRNLDRAPVIRALAEETMSGLHFPALLHRQILGSQHHATSAAALVATRSTGLTM